MKTIIEMDPPSHRSFRKVLEQDRADPSAMEGIVHDHRHLRLVLAAGDVRRECDYARVVPHGGLGHEAEVLPVVDLDEAQARDPPVRARRHGEALWQALLDGLGWILAEIYAVIGNFGLSIIVLTTALGLFGALLGLAILVLKVAVAGAVVLIFVITPISLIKNGLPTGGNAVVIFNSEVRFPLWGENIGAAARAMLDDPAALSGWIEKMGLTKRGDELGAVLRKSENHGERVGALLESGDLAVASEAANTLRMRSRSGACSAKPTASTTGMPTSVTSASGQPPTSQMTTMKSSTKGRSMSEVSVAEVKNSRSDSNSRRLFASVPTGCGAVCGVHGPGRGRSDPAGSGRCRSS